MWRFITNCISSDHVRWSGNAQNHARWSTVNASKAHLQWSGRCMSADRKVLLDTCSTYSSRDSFNFLFCGCYYLIFYNFNEHRERMPFIYLPSDAQQQQQNNKGNKNRHNPTPPRQHNNNDNNVVQHNAQQRQHRGQLNGCSLHTLKKRRPIPCYNCLLSGKNNMLTTKSAQQGRRRSD